MKKECLVKIDGKEISLSILKKKRKNVSIVIKSSSKIQITIPFSVTYSKALEIFQDKKPWIVKHLSKLIENESFKGHYFLGKLYSLEELKDISSFNILEAKEKIHINSIYKKELTRILKNKISFYSNKMEVYPNLIRIKPLKSAWGICYSNKNITFNLNLIKTPIEIIDYLVVHELGHLKHLNHSKEFWNYISKFIENPKKHQKWLKENGYKFNKF